MNEEYEDWLEDKARFCILLKIAPSEYDQLMPDERAAFIQVHNELVEQSKARR